MKVLQVENVTLEEFFTTMRGIVREEVHGMAKAEALTKDYKIIEAARFLGVSREAVESLMKDGVLIRTDKNRITGESLFDFKKGNVTLKQKPGRKFVIQR